MGLQTAYIHIFTYCILTFNFCIYSLLSMGSPIIIRRIIYECRASIVQIPTWVCGRGVVEGVLRNHSFTAAAWACIHTILKLAKCREILSGYLYCMHAVYSLSKWSKAIVRLWGFWGVAGNTSHCSSSHSLALSGVSGTQVTSGSSWGAIFLASF